MKNFRFFVNTAIYAICYFAFCHSVEAQVAEGTRVEVEAQQNNDDSPFVLSVGEAVLVRSKVKGTNAEGRDALVFQRFATSGSVALKETSNADVEVILTNPDGKLKFFYPEEELSDANAKASLTLTLPKNKDSVSFKVSGENGSDSQNDAVVEARLLSGGKSGKAKTTVFWFDGSEMNSYKGNPYTANPYNWNNGTLVFQDFTPRGADNGNTAILLEARTTLRPQGLSESLIQSFGLKLGIIQNSGFGTASLTLEGPKRIQDGTIVPSREDFITWDQKNTSVGDMYDLPQSLILSEVILGGLDGGKDKGKGKDLFYQTPYNPYGESVMAVKEVGETVVTEVDSPISQAGIQVPNPQPQNPQQTQLIPSTAEYVLDNKLIATLQFSIATAYKRKQNFIDWCAVSNSTNDAILLAEGGWSIDLDLPSTDSTKSTATPLKSSEPKTVYSSDSIPSVPPSPRFGTTKAETRGQEDSSR